MICIAAAEAHHCRCRRHTIALLLLQQLMACSGGSATVHPAECVGIGMCVVPLVSCLVAAYSITMMQIAMQGVCSMPIEQAMGGVAASIARVWRLPVVQVEEWHWHQAAALMVLQPLPCTQRVPVNAQGGLGLECCHRSRDSVSASAFCKLAPAGILIQAAPCWQVDLHVCVILSDTRGVSTGSPLQHIVQFACCLCNATYRLLLTRHIGSVGEGGRPAAQHQNMVLLRPQGPHLQHIMQAC